MDLYLRDNDPTKTFLITVIGEELYKIETGATVVLRFQQNPGTGPAALEVGKIEPLQPRGTRLLLCAEHGPLVLRAPATAEVDKWVSYL